MSGCYLVLKNLVSSSCVWVVCGALLSGPQFLWCLLTCVVMLHPLVVSWLVFIPPVMVLDSGAWLTFVADPFWTWPCSCSGCCHVCCERCHLERPTMTDCIDHLHAELVALFVQCVCCCVLLLIWLLIWLVFKLVLRRVCLDQDNNTGYRRGGGNLAQATDSNQVLHGSMSNGNGQSCSHTLTTCR